MLPPGHVAGAYLAGRVASVFIPGLNQPQYLLLTSFFGFFPDLDTFIAFLKAKKMIIVKSINHREFITHAPLVYLLVFAIWYWLFPEARLFSWSFIIGTWSHFFIDTFGAPVDGIPWLYPFSKKNFCINIDRDTEHTERPFINYWMTFVKQYIKLATAKLELLVIIIAFIVYLIK